MAPPSPSKIEAAIQRIVKELYDNGNLEELTVKRVRTAAENNLGLPDRWFRDHEEWKNKSAELIKRVALSYDEGTSSQPAAAEQTPEKPASPVKTQKNKRPSEANDGSEPRKRAKKAQEPAAVPTKRRGPQPKSLEAENVPKSPEVKKKPPTKQAQPKKTKAIDSDDEDMQSEDDAEAPAPAPTKKRGTKSKSIEAGVGAAPPKPTKKAPAKPVQPKKTKKVIDSDDEDEQSGSDTEMPAPIAKTSHASSPDVMMKNGHDEDGTKDEVTEKLQTTTMHEQSESELSSLIDEEPVKRKKKSKEPSAKTTKAKVPKGKESDHKEDEIKRLKDWLKKCGIKKRWLELDKMGSAKEKISYLKRQLADAGMEGRYSLAKAREIREARELAEELEEAQKFEHAWGTKSERSRPKSAAEVMADMGVDLDDDDDDDDE